MIRIYLDSSAFVKRFNEEDGSEIVRGIFDRCEMGELVVVLSQWTINETVVAFDKVRRMSKRVTANDVNNKMIDVISWVENRRREGKVELVGIDDDLIANSMGFIRFNHLSADDSVHAYCAAMGRSNLILMDDKRFSYWLKNPDSQSQEDEGVRPHYSYHVINLSEPDDVEKLKKKLAE